MKRRHFLIMSSLGLASACSSLSGGEGAPKPVLARSYDLRDLQFSAMPGLTVSESESFYPDADIVWRGDPPGPRVAQIGAMFETAVARNRSILQGETPVDLAVTLVRFHGITNSTRLTVGGVYNIVFDMTVLDARNGAVLEPRRRIAANLSAPGGAVGLVMRQQGQTQKVRVTDFLTGVLRQELV